MTIKERILNTNVDQVGKCNRYVEGDIITYHCGRGVAAAIGRLTGEKYDTHRWSCVNTNYVFPEKNMRLSTIEEIELLGDLDYINLDDIPEPTITLNKCEYEEMCSKLNDQTLELVGENTSLQIEMDYLNNKIKKLNNTILDANIRIEELEEEVHKEQELANTTGLLGLRVAALQIENVELSNKLNTIYHISKVENNDK